MKEKITQKSEIPGKVCIQEHQPKKPQKAKMTDIRYIIYNFQQDMDREKGKGLSYFEGCCLVIADQF